MNWWRRCWRSGPQMKWEGCCPFPVVPVVSFWHHVKLQICHLAFLRVLSDPAMFLSYVGVDRVIAEQSADADAAGLNRSRVSWRSDCDSDISVLVCYKQSFCPWSRSVSVCMPWWGSSNGPLGLQTWRKRSLAASWWVSLQLEPPSTGTPALPSFYCFCQICWLWSGTEKKSQKRFKQCFYSFQSSILFPYSSFPSYFLFLFPYSVFYLPLICRTLNSLFLPENMARLSDTFSQAYEMMEADKMTALGWCSLWQKHVI